MTERGSSTLDLLKKISTFKNNCYNIDLSSVSVDYFQPLLETLYSYGVKAIPGLGFNSDLSLTVAKELHAFRNSRRADSEVYHPPIEFEGSIFQNNAQFISELVGLLSRILPRTESIFILKFRSMLFEYRDIDVLSQSIYQCETLRVLKLHNIPLHDEGFERLSQALRRKSVTTLQCRNCKLTDQIADSLISLINYQTYVQREAERKAEQMKDKNLGIVCISMYDFRDNKFSNNFVSEIENEVDNSSILRFDLRGNHISVDKVHSPKIVAGKMNKRLTVNAAQTQEQRLEETNQRLHQILEQLTNGQKIALLSPGLYAIGARAPELADHIQMLDQFYGKIESGEISQKQLKKKPSLKKKKPKYLVRRSVSKV